MGSGAGLYDRYMRLKRQQEREHELLRDLSKQAGEWGELRTATALSAFLNAWESNGRQH